MSNKVKYKRKAIPIPLTEYFIIRCEVMGILGIYTLDKNKVHKTHTVEIGHFSGVIRKYYFYILYDEAFLAEVN